MSDPDKSYKQQVQHFSEIVDEFKDELRNSLDEMSRQISKNRMDADNLTQGNERHGIKSVREVAENARAEAEKANKRLDKLIWTVSGAAGGGGLGGAYIFELLQGLL